MNALISLLVAMISIVMFSNLPLKASATTPDNVEDFNQILSSFNLSLSFVGTESTLTKPNSSPVLVSSSKPSSAPSNATSGSFSSKPTNQPNLRPFNITNPTKSPMKTPLTSSLSSSPVHDSSSKPSTYVCTNPFFWEGPSLIFNKTLPYGGILSFHPDGYVLGSGVNSNSTDADYVVEKLSSETFLIKQGNLPSNAEFLISFTNSTIVYLTAAGSSIKIIGSIPGGTALTFYKDGVDEVSRAPKIPFLFKKTDCNYTLITGGNLPTGFMVYFSESYP
jgi:hypothetical protein